MMDSQELLYEVASIGLKRTCERDEARAEVERLRGERARIVAWLRRGAELTDCYDAAHAYAHAAHAIERGEHEGTP